MRRQWFSLLRAMVLSLVAGAGGGCAAQGPGELVVVLKVPDAAWTLAIREVWAVEGRVVVVAAVARPADAMAAQRITERRATVAGRFPDTPRRVLVVGKTWNWRNDEPVEFVTAEAAALAVAGGRRLWPDAAGG